MVASVHFLLCHLKPTTLIAHKMPQVALVAARDLNWEMEDNRPEEEISCGTC